jgi:hypothetical protein
MSKIDDAMATLESRDWSGAVVDDRPRASSVVHSVRMPHALTERLFAEAERCGITPSELIRQAVEARLDAGRPSEVVTIDVAVLHQAIDQAVRRAA